MLFLADIIVLFLLGLVVLQDFRERAISWFLPPLLFIVCGIKGFSALKAGELFSHTAFNILFIALQLLLLSGYISLKNKKWTNIIDTHLGAGDILFFIALSIAFTPLNFIVFYISGMLVTLSGFIIFRLSSRRAETEIPLAGGMAAVMIAAMIACYFIPAMSFYDDRFFISAF